MKKTYEKLRLGITEDADVIATSGNQGNGDNEYKDEGGDTMPDWDLNSLDGLYNF